MDKSYKYDFSIIINLSNYVDISCNVLEKYINEYKNIENIQLVFIKPKNKMMEFTNYKNSNVIFIHEREKISLNSKYYCELNDLYIFKSNQLKTIFNFFKKNNLFIDNIIINLKNKNIKNGIYNFEQHNLLQEKNLKIIFCKSERFYYNKGIYLNAILNIFNRNSFGLLYLPINKKYELKNNVVYDYDEILKNLTKGNFLSNHQKIMILFYLKELCDFELPKKVITKKIIDKIKTYIRNIDVLYILNCNFLSEEIKMFLLKILEISSNDKIVQCYKYKYITKITLNIVDVKFSGEKFKIDLMFNKYVFNDIRVVILDSNDKAYFATEEKSINSIYDKKIGDCVVDNTHVAKFSFDVNKVRRFRFAIYDLKTKRYFPFYKIILNKNLKLNSILKKYKYKSYVIKYEGKKISIMKNFKDKRKTSYFKNQFIDCIKIFVSTKKFLLLRLFSRRSKKYILINDRPNKAGDNGEALFKYIYCNNRKLSKNTYYVISKRSKDYKRLKKIGRIIPYGTLKHKIKFINSRYIYTSHIREEYYSPFKDKKNYIDLLNYKLVWLQHGITMNDIRIDYYSKKIDYIITSTIPEYSQITSDKLFYSSKNVLLTGMARFDCLRDCSSNVITLAPTWRRGIAGGILDSKEILKNTYFNTYFKILSNKRLISVLKKHKYKLKFVLHPEMSEYILYFKKYENKYIQIIKDINYNEMFMESKLLITDYSSILFDFAYLRKPEIYFQFDKENFFHNHYGKGYFDYQNDGFGDVILDVEELVDKIVYYFQNDFKVEKKYLDRIKKTFKYTDKNNCKRIIEETYR